MSNTSDFTLLKEDHTLGNLLAEHLKQAPHVLMAGYKSNFPLCRPFYTTSTVTTILTYSPLQSLTLMCLRF